MLNDAYICHWTFFNQDLEHSNKFIITLQTSRARYKEFQSYNPCLQINSPWINTTMGTGCISFWLKYFHYLMMVAHEKKIFVEIFWLMYFILLHPVCSLRCHTYSISQEICTRFCCALLCCGYAIVHNEFTWSIYPYSSGLLCWHWGNR